MTSSHSESDGLPHPAGGHTAIYYRLLLESAKDFAIFATDPERRVTMWSAGAERIFGQLEAEMLGQSADVIFTPEDRSKGAPEAEAAEALAKGRAEDERWHLRKRGERFYASGVMTQFRDESGVPIGFVKIVRDLTERKLAQEVLQASRDALARGVEERTRELRQANEALRKEMAERIAAEMGRQQLLRRIATAQEEERRRIARDMHDTIGQHLAALMLRLNALELALAGSANQALVKEPQQLTETIGRELHALALQLRPTDLDDLGLAGAVSSYVELWSSRAKVPVHTHMMNLENPRLPEELELALYRIVQEALTNVLKHAAASRVSLVITRAGGEVVAMIEDNGRGFAAEESAALTDGLGLLGMQERVVSFGGRLTIESQPGRGTTVLVRVPLNGS